MARQNVFVIGATGNVGSELVRQILVHDSPVARLPQSYLRVEHENPTVIVGVANRSGYRVDPAGVPIEPHELQPFREIEFDSEDEEHLRAEIRKADKWRRFVRQRVSRARGWEEWRSGGGEQLAQRVPDFDAVLRRIRNEGLDGDVIFIDVTADSEILPSFHQRIISQTNNRIVTANKYPVADSSIDEFRRITSERDRYGFRCTVMAGAQVVTHLMELYDSDEHVVKIEGCLSGSLGYLCSELEEGKRAFSEVVKNAMELKYTEPDPREDLGGMDVARKLVIIARCLGLDVELCDIAVTGFVDSDKYHDRSVKEFIGLLSQEEDGRIREVFDAGMMRYVATLECYDQRSSKPQSIEVCLKEISGDSNLAPLKGSANMVSIQSKTFPKGKEYVIKSPGAGVGITANGIRRDLLSMLKGRKSGRYSL